MAYQNVIACNNIQDAIDDHFKCVTKTEQLPVVDFVWSDINLERNLGQTISPGNGKIRQVELSYTQRLATSVVSDDPTFTCASDNHAGQLSTTYALDLGDGVRYSEAFTLATLAEMCEDNGVWLARRIQAMFDVLLRRMEEKMTEQLVTWVGKFASNDNDLSAGGTLKTVESRDASNKIDLNFWGETIYSLRDLIGYCGTPFLFGYGELTKVMREMRAGCCATYGIDLGTFANQNELVYFHSNFISEFITANNYITVDPGSVQPIWYNAFVGKNGINQFETETLKQMVVQDPRYGIPFDYKMVVQDCGDVIVEIGLPFALVGLPDDLYDNADRLDGVTGVNQFAIANP